MSYANRESMDDILTEIAECPFCTKVWTKSLDKYIEGLVHIRENFKTYILQEEDYKKRMETVRYWARGGQTP